VGKMTCSHFWSSLEKPFGSSEKNPLFSQPQQKIFPTPMLQNHHFKINPSMIMARMEFGSSVKPIFVLH